MIDDLFIMLSTVEILCNQLYSELYTYLSLMCMRLLAFRD